MLENKDTLKEALRKGTDRPDLAIGDILQTTDYYSGRGDTNKALVLNSHGWDGLFGQKFCYAMLSIILSVYFSSQLDF